MGVAAHRLRERCLHGRRCYSATQNAPGLLRIRHVREVVSHLVRKCLMIGRRLLVSELVRARCLVRC